MKNKWIPKSRAEQQYARDLFKIISEYFATPEHLRFLTFEQWLDAWAKQAAQRMITGVAVDNARTWREAAMRSMRGAEIHALLMQELRGATGQRMRELIEENAKLIRSLPREISRKVTAKIAEQAMEGERAEVSKQSILRYTSHLANWHVRLIARTETSKASTALTQARAEELGLDWYVWLSSEDSRVRISHRFMAKQGGVLVNWKDAPSPERLVGEKSEGFYHAGNIYNCRCYPAPLLRTDQVAWPHRVYRNGSVQMTTLAAFRRIADIGRRQDRLGAAA